MMLPLLLGRDNFTPASRTPWGGLHITGSLKRGLLEGSAAARQVGESWELSVEPDFPSRLEDGRLLAEVLASDPAAYLGPSEAALGSTRLLVKLLDAAEPLSVQIHPEDGAPGLRPSESGKPEAWYVVRRDEGAGLFIGLEEGVTEARLREGIAAGEDVSRLFHFVPAEPGDFFSIEAGTPHAVGAGLTLVEPQRVHPGRHGVTYRYWDWNRRYAPDGLRDEHGAPRALHLQEALAVTAWEGPRGAALLSRIRHRAGVPSLEGPARYEPLAGEGAPISTGCLRVSRLSGTGALRLPDDPRLRALTAVAGTIRLSGAGYRVELAAGRTLALPAALSDVSLELAGAHALLSSIA